MSKICLTLNPDGRWVIQQLSTDAVAGIVIAALIPADNILTYIFRLPRVNARDIPNSMLPPGASVSTQGAPIDYALAHPGVAIGTMVVTAAVTAANLYSEGKKLKRGFDKGSYRSIFGAITAFEQKQLQEKHDEIKRLARAALANQNYDALRTYLEGLRFDRAQQEAFIKNLKNSKFEAARDNWLKKQAGKKAQDQTLQLATKIAEEALRQYEFRKLGEYLEEIRNSDPELQKKYKSIKLNPVTNQIEFDLQDPDEIYATDTLETVIKKTARRAIKTADYFPLNALLRRKFSFTPGQVHDYISELRNQITVARENMSLNIDALAAKLSEELFKRDELPNIIKHKALAVLNNDGDLNARRDLRRYLQETFQVNEVQQDMLIQLLYNTRKKQPNADAAAEEFAKLVMRKPKAGLIASSIDALTRKVFTPVYGALGIASYVYWIMWMSAGLFTGQFGGGIFGLTAGEAFGIPLALGALYPFTKVVNWGRKLFRKSRNLAEQDETPVTEEQVGAAVGDTELLLRRAMQRRKFEVTKQELRKLMGPDYTDAAADRDDEILQAQINAHYAGSQTLDGQVGYLGKEIKTKTALDFTNQLVSGYVGVQYASWIVSDIVMAAGHFLSIIPVVNIVVGAALFVLSGVRAIYNTVVNYRERAKLAEEVKIRQAYMDGLRARRDTLEDLYKSKLEQINQVKARLQQHGIPTTLPGRSIEFDQPQFLNDVNRSGPNEETKWKKGANRALLVLNAFMTGAFVARMFFVANTAIFLPFIALAGGPYTMPLVALGGIIWAGVQLYKFYKDRREARARDTLRLDKERIECLEQSVREADLELRVLNKRERDFAHHPAAAVAHAPANADEFGPGPGPAPKAAPPLIEVVELQVRPSPVAGTSPRVADKLEVSPQSATVKEESNPVIKPSGEKGAKVNHVFYTQKVDPADVRKNALDSPEAYLNRKGSIL